MKPILTLLLVVSGFALGIVTHHLHWQDSLTDATDHGVLSPIALIGTAVWTCFIWLTVTFTLRLPSHSRYDYLPSYDIVEDDDEDDFDDDEDDYDDDYDFDDDEDYGFDYDDDTEDDFDEASSFYANETI